MLSPVRPLGSSVWLPVTGLRVLLSPPLLLWPPREQGLCVHVDRLHPQQCLAWHVVEPLENIVAKDTEELPCEPFSGVWFRGNKCVHVLVPPSPPSTGRFSFCKTETLYVSISNSPPLPQPGSHLPTVCPYDSGDSRLVPQVSSIIQCLSLFHSALCPLGPSTL